MSRLLQPLSIPTTSWQVISLNFGEGLPPAWGKNYILVIVDRFSKFNNFIHLKHHFNALQVAIDFMEDIYNLNGKPTSIVSDHDQVFRCKIWPKLFYMAGVSLKMSLAYHSQTNGQTDCVNQCMKKSSLCLISVVPSKWIVDYTLWNSSIILLDTLLSTTHLLRSFVVTSLTISALVW